MVTFQITLLSIFAVLNVLAAVYDFAFYRIPNILIAVMLVLYVPYAAFYVGGMEILFSVLYAFIALAVGFTLFSFGLLGGGDAKLVAAVVLWMGGDLGLAFLIYMGLFGGALGLFYFFLPTLFSYLSTKLWVGMRWLEDQVTVFQLVWAQSGQGVEHGVQPAKSSKHIPYGVAIAASVVLLIYDKVNALLI